jgi:hypothetical protein
MSLTVPNLDDRTWAQLVEEARRRAMTISPEWTDLTPNDPGMALLELFAFLTDTMISRLNRLPEKAYVEFLRLIGVHIHPPSAARAALVFSRTGAADAAITVPRGTRVSVARASGGGEPPVFVTADTVTLAAGADQVTVNAYHCDMVDGELIGQGTGLPGLSLSVQRPPIIAPTGTKLDLVVGVQATAEELVTGAEAIEDGGKSFRIWREVDTFAAIGDDPYAYVTDRAAGTITFAPAIQARRDDGTLAEIPGALGAVPPAGREIRVWYWRGGGPEGNVAAGTLTTLKDTPGGVQVTNPEPASGGRAAESFDNAYLRGPQELYSLQRAVTARDYQQIALKGSGAVGRARALTQADLWTFATPGTVEVLLVPAVPESDGGTGTITAEMLQARQDEDARVQVQQTLDARRPLGTACLVHWAHYKTVRVRARIVVRREEDREAVRQRVRARLIQSITPLPTPLTPTGWPFGQALRAFHVYRIASAEPGVRWVDNVRFVVDPVPNGTVRALAVDPFQERTWYAGSNGTLFRSLNRGDGWEPAAQLAEETIEVIAPHPERAGLLAMATTVANDGGSRVHLSWDCAETWPESAVQTIALRIEGLAWITRGGIPVLLLATNQGLYELETRPGGSPVQVIVNTQDPTQGFYAVVAATDVQGETSVAVAAQGSGGVLLSSDAGKSGSFRFTGLGGEDIRALAVQRDGPRLFLWAGVTVSGGEADPGKGCFSRELLGAVDPPNGWQPHMNGWSAGSCLSIACQGTRILASSYRAGVLRLDASERDPAWQAPDVRSGLLLRVDRRGQFEPVFCVAADARDPTILAGGTKGVFRSRDGGITYASVSQAEFEDTVTLPPTWLFCSAEPDITVESDDETQGD